MFNENLRGQLLSTVFKVVDLLCNMGFDIGNYVLLYLLCIIILTNYEVKAL